MTRLLAGCVVKPVGSTLTHLFGKVNERMGNDLVAPKEIRRYIFVTTGSSVRRFVGRQVALLCSTVAHAFFFLEVYLGYTLVQPRFFVTVWSVAGQKGLERMSFQESGRCGGVPLG